MFQMRNAVQAAARYFPTAIVSGRCRDKVKTSSIIEKKKKTEDIFEIIVSFYFIFCEFGIII